MGRLTLGVVLPRLPGVKVLVRDLLLCKVGAEIWEGDKRRKV